MPLFVPLIAVWLLGALLLLGGCASGVTVADGCAADQALAPALADAAAKLGGNAALYASYDQTFVHPVVVAGCAAAATLNH